MSNEAIKNLVASLQQRAFFSSTILTHITSDIGLVKILILYGSCKDIFWKKIIKRR